MQRQNLLGTVTIERGQSKFEHKILLHRNTLAALPTAAKRSFLSYRIALYCLFDVARLSKIIPPALDTKVLAPEIDTRTRLRFAGSSKKRSA